MSVTTDCSLVVVGPPADIEALETDHTAQAAAAVEVDEAPLWEALRGWPSPQVVRRGTPERGLVLFDFSVRRVHPGGWVERRALEWPRLEFRAQYALDERVVGRDWLTAAGVTRSEWLSSLQTRRFLRSGGWWRWLEQAGMSKEERDAAQPVEIWCEPWLKTQLAKAAVTRSGEPGVDEAAALTLVRTALADGSLRGMGPLTLNSGTALADPERAAESWLREAGGDGWIARTARRHLVSLSAALVEKPA